MVHFIAKGRNAATGEGGRAHRERTECATAVLQALAIRRVFPAGCALHRRAPFALMRHYSCGTALWYKKQAGAMAGILPTSSLL